jgi:mRNA-degrading endonuclease RelE of RelBE toxin-antitoxin system
MTSIPSSISSARTARNERCLFVDELEKRTTAFLSQFPASGRRVGTGRYLVLDNYVVAYDIDEERKAVFVLLVSEGHRLWRNILKERRDV